MIEYSKPETLHHFLPMRFFEHKKEVLRKPVDLSAFGIEGFQLTVLREDLLHPVVSGNKFRKLKYNFYQAKKEGYSRLITFGGAFSNHILAVACAARECSFQSIGIIRGEELVHKWANNATLSRASEFGMRLHFVSRFEFRQKDQPGYQESLQREFGPSYMIPEGGTNELAVRGCEEILSKSDTSHDYICTSVGTGGTMAGIVRSAGTDQHVIGYSALKGTFQREVIDLYTEKTDYTMTDAWCFGGYAKIDSDLVRFINEFRSKTGIPLDPVYTGKMMYGIIDGMRNGYFRENSRILAVHTGGLQGIAGMNQILKQKNLPLLHE